MMSYGRLIKRQVMREALLHVRELSLLVNSLLFFLMILVFFPLTMPAETALLRTVAPGIVWIAVLLAMLLSAERLFQRDYEDGVIEQWLVSGYPLSLLVSIKVIIHWFLNLLPLIFLSPILGILFSFSLDEILALMFSLLSGTPALLFLCALAAVFSIGLRQKGVMMALVLFPLTIPVMIFGSSAITAAMQGFAISGYLALLLAFSVVAAGFLPFAIAAMIRISLVE
ncbi:heme exporter protein CcmB [Legionella londiniensis]|uniref:Heme exporter protein B n=1 Tax=Legionella londiniensis TaxID=45068 RepID=A0A0W0VMA6_9GAMM|nr:heme exporter protein CcmB [Legionella londiniensis]KTD21196.1 heme exporter protein CcmB [Legionella londiniensis]STX93221.1 heme exporter protein CcmB [Legionella londiniensis]